MKTTMNRMQKCYEPPLVLGCLLDSRMRVCIGEGSIQDYERDEEQDINWD